MYEYVPYYINLEYISKEKEHIYTGIELNMEKSDLITMQESGIIGGAHLVLQM